MKEVIPFNVPCSIGIEPALIQEAINRRHLSGNGHFTQQVHRIFEEEMGFEKVLMTNSCTAALEMAAYLCEFLPGEEVILPSFTHVGTANAFERAGGSLVFADSLPDHPNIDVKEVARLIGPKTKAVVAVHYAGVGCEMEELQALCQAHGLLLIEDAAHALGASYHGKPLGSFGDLAAFSFHETKNLTCGQGGLLVINRERFVDRALRFWENGTNRASFYRGEVDHYTWVDTGFCYLPSELNAAYLYGQLQHREEIFARRNELWNVYHQEIGTWSQDMFQIPKPSNAPIGHNAHIFYLDFKEGEMRDKMLNHLHKHHIGAVFHYIPLHNSPHYRSQGKNVILTNCERHSSNLLRLPLFHSLKKSTIKFILGHIQTFVWDHSKDYA
ncbi:UNVERIFIED_CONTAM: hypothetical protein GTU68_030998 [Idotea baltica]|nr:hypothetical protein [Idotea baltica]